MQTIYKEELTSVLSGLKEKYTNVVVMACNEMPNNTIVFGNTEIILKGDTPYIRVTSSFSNQPKSEFVELFGEDGYPQIESMAHWADICEDIVKSMKSGNSKYTMFWNVNMDNARKFYQNEISKNN